MIQIHTLKDYTKEVKRLAPNVIFSEDWGACVQTYYHQGWSPETTAKHIRMILAGTEYIKK